MNIFRRLWTLLRGGGGALPGDNSVRLEKQPTKERSGPTLYDPHDAAGPRSGKTRRLPRRVFDKLFGKPAYAKAEVPRTPVPPPVKYVLPLATAPVHISPEAIQRLRAILHANAASIALAGFSAARAAERIMEAEEDALRLDDEEALAVLMEIV